MPWDASELDRLAADLDRSAAEIAVSVRQIVAKGAVNVKKQMREEMQASQHFKPAAHRITYDLKTEGTDTVVAEIGPTHGTEDPGSLANLAYFGTSKGGGTVPDPVGALEAEGGRMTSYLEKLVGGLL